MTKEAIPLTEAQVQVLYTRGIIDQVTWSRVLRAFRGDPSSEGWRAIATCEVAIEALVERAVDAACAAIQERLGVKTGDLAAAILSDGAIERELTRYVHAELAMAGSGDEEYRSSTDRASSRSRSSTPETNMSNEANEALQVKDQEKKGDVP